MNSEIKSAAELKPQTVELTDPVLTDERSDKVEFENQRGEKQTRFSRRHS